MFWLFELKAGCFSFACFVITCKNFLNSSHSPSHAKKPSFGTFTSSCEIYKVLTNWKKLRSWKGSKCSWQVYYWFTTKEISAWISGLKMNTTSQLINRIFKMLKKLINCYRGDAIFNFVVTFIYVQKLRETCFTQGRIQSFSSYANGEVVFPSYEMLNRLKKPLRGVLIQSNNLCIFPRGLWCAKFSMISSVKLLFWSMSFEGDCRSVKVFRLEFLTLKHPISQHLPKFILKKLVCLSFW